MKKNRSGVDLCSMLSHYLKIPVRMEWGEPVTITPHIIQWVEPTTGERRWMNDRFEVPFCDPIRHLDREILFVFGPMRYERYKGFHPNLPLWPEVCRLIDDYMEQPHLQYKAKMIVIDPPPIQLDGVLTVGFDTWFPSWYDTEEDKKKPKERIFYRQDRSWLVEYEKKQQSLAEAESGSQKKLCKTFLPEDFSHHIFRLQPDEKRQLYEYFIREKEYFSELSAEWTFSHPQAAENLKINEYGRCVDYEISRFFELTAFLVARVRHKIDEPPLRHIAKSLLEKSNPNLFLPLPALSIVKLDLQSSVKNTSIFPRHSPVILKHNGQDVFFRTCFETQVVPAKVTSADILYAFQGFHVSPAKRPLIESTLVLDLECLNEKGFGALELNSLRFFINLPRELGLCLHESLFTNVIAMVAYDMSDTKERYLGTLYAPHVLQLVGFGEDELALPRPFRSESEGGSEVENNLLNTHARHLFHEFAQYPEKFLFFDVKSKNEEIRTLLASCGKKLQIRLFLKENLDRDVERAIDKDVFCLNAVPAINLFEGAESSVTIKDNMEPFEVQMKPGNLFYHFKYLNVFHKKTNSRRYCTNVEKNIDVNKGDFSLLLLWKKDISKKSIFDNELEKFSVNIFKDQEKVNLEGHSLEFQILSMNSFQKNTIFTPGRPKKLTPIVSQFVPIKTIYPHRTSVLDPLEMWNTLSRVPITQLFYDDNRVKALKKFMRGFGFHSQTHTNNPLDQIKSIAPSIRPGWVSIQFKDDTRSNGIHFDVEYAVPPKNGEIKKSNLIFIKILSLLLGENYADTSFVYVSLKYEDRIENGFDSGYVTGKLRL